MKHKIQTGSGLRLPRVFGLVSAGALAFCFWGAVISYLHSSASIQDAIRMLLFENPPSAGTWAFFQALTFAPVALVLWWFRDTNQLWQIENARKDINLKDFQKLCEWASGSALVEEEVTRTKRGRVESTKSTRPHITMAAYSATRRQGSEALQLASVQQLGGYLVGANGQQFTRPALEMLLALWQSQTQSVRSEISPLLYPNKMSDVDSHIKRWKEADAAFQDSVLSRALTYALLTNQNRALLNLSAFLPKQVLTGLNTALPGLHPLKLWYRNLDGVDLQSAKLYKAQLQGASLVGAQLNLAELSLAQLQGAKLNAANLQYTRLESAHLEGVVLRVARAESADFFRAQLQDTDFFDAYLSSTNLQEANLQGARLIHTRMTGAIFTNADLRDAWLINPVLDNKTTFLNAITSKSTLVGVVKRHHEAEKKRAWVPVLTHALRLNLKNKNHLSLAGDAYEEFAIQWAKVSSVDQTKILENIYTYASDIGLFSTDFPALET